MSNKISSSVNVQCVRPRMMLSEKIMKRLEADAAHCHRKIYEQMAWIIEQYYRGGGKEEASNG